MVGVYNHQEPILLELKRGKTVISFGFTRRILSLTVGRIGWALIKKQDKNMWAFLFISFVAAIALVQAAAGVFLLDFPVYRTHQT
jgi:hypothetical protein